MSWNSTSRFLLMVLLSVAIPCGLVDGAVYIKIGDIKGELKAPGFEGWVEAESVGMDGAIVGKSFGSLSIRKRIDQSTPLLAQLCVQGKPVREVVIVFPDESVEGEFVPKAILKLRDVLVKKIEQFSEGGDETMEVLTVHYRSVLFRYPTSDGDEVKFADLDGGNDTDGDGMSDLYEKFHGFDPLVKDGDEDADDDGLSNATEAKLGLNPRSASSFFKAKGRLKPDDSSKFTISWEGKPGIAYDIYCTPALGKPFVFLRRITAEDFEAGWDVDLSGFRGFYQVRPVTE